MSRVVVGSDSVAEFSRNSEIVATFLVNRFFNELYQIALSTIKQGPAHLSLTAAYAHIVTEYVAEIDRTGDTPTEVDLLRKTIDGLRQYYCSYSSEISLDEFVSRIVSQVVPADYFGVMRQPQRAAILRAIVKQSVVEMGTRVLKVDMLRNIIDERQNLVGVGVLRDVGIKVIADFRATLISKLFGDQIKSSRVVTAEMYEKLRAQLLQTIAECSRLAVSEKEWRAKYARLEHQARATEQTLRAEIARVTEIARATLVPISIPRVDVAPRVRVERSASPLRTEVPVVSEETHVSEVAHASEAAHASEESDFALPDETHSDTDDAQEAREAFDAQEAQKLRETQSSFPQGRARMRAVRVDDDAQPMKMHEPDDD
jgi:hypothetical protein